jgi:hypothetical protein
MLRSFAMAVSARRPGLCRWRQHECASSAPRYLGEFGGDVSHLNLHKTFCDLHGGGGSRRRPEVCVGDLVLTPPGHATAGRRP